MKVERGDIVVYKRKNFLGWTESEGVVHDVYGDEVDMGIDGRIPRHRIVEVKGKSPSYDSQTGGWRDLEADL